MSAGHPNASSPLNLYNLPFAIHVGGNDTAYDRNLKAAEWGMKLEQLRSKRSELLARSKVAEAQNRVHDAVKSVDVLDPTSELGRFEDKIRREEALAAGKQELAASSIDAQFNQLEDVGELTEVEARLAMLKSGGASRAAIDAPSPDSV